MSTKVWFGGAAKVAQIDRVTIPSTIEAGMVIIATIGDKTISYTVLSSESRDDVVNAIVATWNSTAFYEFAEVTASVETTENYEGDSEYTGDIILTANTAGIPFVVVWSIGDSGGNEKQIVTLGNSPTGGTFTLTFGGYTTSNLGYDTTASEVKAAMEILTSIGVNNISVSGNDGGPYTVEFIGDLAETDVSLITSDASSLTGINEEQVITLETATGGTFVLSFNGELTAPLAFDATEAEIQAALESLTSIGLGNALVSGPDGGPWTVTFQNDLGKSEQTLIEVDGTNLTGGLDVSISTTTPAVEGGGNQRYAIWGQLSFFKGGGEFSIASSPKDGYVKLVGDSNTSGGTFDLTLSLCDVLTAIPYDVTAGELQNLIDAAVSASKRILVLSDDTGGSGGVGVKLSDGSDFWLMYPASNHRIAYEWFDFAEATATVSNTDLSGGNYSVTTSNNEYGYKDYTISSGPFTDDFRLTFGGKPSGAIGVSATGQQIQEALEKIPAFAGNVTVLGNLNSTYLFGSTGAPACYFELTGALANQPLYTSYSGGSVNSDGGYVRMKVEVKRQWIGSAGTNEVQELKITGSPASGKFALKYIDDSTDMLDFDSTATEVEAALEDLNEIGAGNISCTGGPLPSTAINIEFIANLNSTEVEQIATISGGIVNEQQAGGSPPYVDVDTFSTPMAYSTDVASEGPNDWTTTENWSGNSLPIDGDKVYIIDNAYSILYGLDQASVTLAELHIEQTYTGLIGLPVINVNSEDATIAYPEYRDQYLIIGSTNVFIGDKDGDGSQRLKINFGSVQTTLLVTNSGGRLDDATPPIQLLGTHASNVLNINRGDVAIAFYPGEVSTFATIRQAFIDNAESDATLYVGDDVTLTNIHKSGGTAILKSATTLIDQTAGTLTIEEGTHAEINSFAGLIYYNSIDTLALIDISGDTTLSFDQDRRPKDVTLIQVNGSEPEVYDQSNAITSPKVNLERGASSQQLYLGSKIQVSIGSIS